MKKFLLPAALLCSFAALAQTPAASAQHPDAYAVAQLKQEAKSEDFTPDDHEGGNGNAAATANHGQAVAAFAHSTTLTGADKGAAVSALARNGRSTARGEHKHDNRKARGERGARGNQCRDNKPHRKQQNGGRRGRR